MAIEDMKPDHTPSGKPFRYKGDPSAEIIVYPSDEDGQHQDRFALAITRFESDLVQGLIRQHGRILLGASRDRPSEGSLGAFLKSEGLTPQHLSYLIPILKANGICTVSRDGQAFVVEHREP